MKRRFFYLMLVVLGLGAGNIFGQSEDKSEDKEITAVKKVETISTGIINGKAIFLPKPEYPAAAKAVRAYGAVNVQVTIDEQGNVISATAVSGHPLLRVSAVNAAKQAKFAPTRLKGEPVKVSGIIVYDFVLPAELTVKEDSSALLPLTLAMFLASLKELPADEESNKILLDIGSSLPAEFKVEKRLFERLIQAGPIEKPQIIDSLIVSMKNGADKTDTWAINFGKCWGEAIGQAYKLSNNDYRGDRRDFIANLEMMNLLLESPPAELSEQILAKLSSMAAYNSETDTISADFIRDFLTASLNLMDYLIEQNRVE
jgi:TonB family protein